MLITTCFAASDVIAPELTTVTISNTMGELSGYDFPSFDSSKILTLVILDAWMDLAQSRSYPRTSFTSHMHAH